MSNQTYVLVTAAHNEERFIRRVIESVVSQTFRPKQWVIVNDASTDRTDEIVESYVRNHRFMRLLRITADHPRNFAAQVNAINKGFAGLQHTDYAFVGNLDADVSFSPTYFSDLLCRFDKNPRLGLAGGVIHEKDTNIFKPLCGDSLKSVAHAVQVFRRACYETIGGYPELLYGGPDTYAEVMARMNGWDVQAFPDLVVHHHRYTASAGGLLRGKFRQGLMDFSLGYHPVFEVAKCARRMTEKPVMLGALVRLIGFCWSYRQIRNPMVSDEFVRFLRKEQLERLRGCFSLSSTR